MASATPPKAQPYSVTTGGKKAASTGGWMAGVAAVAVFTVQVARSNGWAFWEEQLDEEAIGVITILLSAVVRFGTNWFKNRDNS